jgi:glucose/arabinose dehydrogenase
MPVISGLSAPIDIVNAGDGSNRLFIAQQGGLIRVWNGSSLLATPFLDLSSQVTFSGEMGLLSVVFHPAYETNGYFFVYYNNTSGAVTLARYKVSADPNVADPASGAILLSLPKPAGRTNHNGGDLNFGPDGMLYLAIGDGGGSGDPDNLAQNGSSLFGKMIRLNVSDFSMPAPYYTIPTDNPYYTDPAVDDRVYALGLRNPFRWSFDRANGNMWIGDVGQDVKEEVNFRTPLQASAGTNYGWRCYEGTSPYNTSGCSPASGYTAPVFEYNNPTPGAAAVTGGFVYRGTEYPGFRGYYVAADVYSGNVYLVWPNGSGGWNSATQTGLQNYIVTFGEAENGTLYAASQGTGTVYKVAAAGGTPLPVSLISFGGKRSAAFTELTWVTVAEWGTARFHIEVSTDGVRFIRSGTVSAGRKENGQSYSFRHNVTPSGDVYYRLAVEDDNGTVRYSAVIRLSGYKEGLRIYPTLIRNHSLTIETPGHAEKIMMYNGDGKLVFEKRLNTSGTVTITLPDLAKGMYIVQVRAGGEVKKERVIIE